jgi:predicted nuclease with TOPRIM domain
MVSEKLYLENIMFYSHPILHCSFCIIYRYEEIKEELEEFQLSSQELEAELEGTLEQAESKNKDLSASKCRLEMEVDSLRVSYTEKLYDFN